MSRVAKALAVASAVLVAGNLLRIGVIACAIRVGGIGPGYQIGHLILGSLVSIVCIGISLALLTVIVTSRDGGRLRGALLRWHRRPRMNTPFVQVAVALAQAVALLMSVAFIIYVLIIVALFARYRQAAGRRALADLAPVHPGAERGTGHRRHDRLPPLQFPGRTSGSSTTPATTAPGRSPPCGPSSTRWFTSSRAASRTPGPARGTR